MILVTGAAGKTGIAVIRALREREAEVRAFVHRQEHVAAMEALGVQDIVVGDLRAAGDARANDAGRPRRRSGGLRPAVEGVRAVYHVPPNVHPDEIEIGRLLVDAAADAGVEQFVYHSVLHPQAEAMPHHWKKLRVEEYLVTGGLPYTILQPAAYMQNVSNYLDSIVATGVYTVPYAVETRLSMVDLRDVAEAAAIVLTEDGHNAAIYELCGPAALSQIDVAETLSRHLGVSVHAETMPRAEWEAHAWDTGSMSGYAIDTLRKMFRYYEKYNFVGNPNVLHWLLGRPPTRFESFVARTVGDRAT